MVIFSSLDLRYFNRRIFSKIFLSLLVLGLSTINCYKAPQSGGLLDFLNLSNLSQMLSTPQEINVQVNGLAASSVGLTIELASTAEQITFTSAGSATFLGTFDVNQTYVLNLIQQPTVVSPPTQTCIISNPNLYLTYASNTFVVNCATVWYKANVAVTGIASSNTTNLQVINNGIETKTTSANGTISFDVGDGLGYAITIGTTPTVPAAHTCQVLASPSPTGTIAGADVSVSVSCISLMSTSFASGAFMGSSKSMVFSFSGPVTAGSCTLDSTGGGPPYYAGANTGGVTLNYSGNTVTVTPVTFPWNFGVSFPQLVNFTLSSCSDAVATSAIANNGTALSVAVKMVDGDAYFVSNTSGSDSNSCSDPSDSCKTIQTAVNLCSPSLICNVFVESGTYTIATAANAISLSSAGGVRLLGSFDSAFNTQSLDLTPSTITDARSVATCQGTVLSLNECAPITISANGMAGDTNKAHAVVGFAIVADINKVYSFGIRILDGDVGSYTFISGNYISGGTVAGNSTPGGIRGGIYLKTSKSNNQIDTNVIKGGFGSDSSFGIYAYDSSVNVIRNRLSGDQGFTSAAVGITNYNNPIISIINNTMNYVPYTDGSVTSTYNYGVYSYDGGGSATTQYYIAGNTIYAGGAGATNYGFYMSGQGTNAQMLNNVVSISAANATCAYFDNTPSGSAVFRGNNLDCPAGTKVFNAAIPATYSSFCSATGTFNINGLCLVANSFMNRCSE